MRKKILLEFEELELIPADLGCRASYPRPGLYLVNDGVVRHMVIVHKDEKSYPCLLPIPIEEIEKHKCLNPVTEEIPAKLSVIEDTNNRGEWVSGGTLLELVKTVLKK